MVVMKRPYFKEDREIEAELDRRQFNQAMFQRFIAKPSLVRTHTTPLQFENLRIEINKITNRLRVHETILSDLQDQIRAVRKSRNFEEEATARIEATSIENTKYLRALFKLPAIVENIDEDVLANMKGMLKVKSKEKIDSVELLHMIRGE
jgi:hypothetical protein